MPRFAELNAEFEIQRELGRGGTAVVYLAVDRELDREVAIKVIRSAYVEDEEAAARLVREARTLGHLQHPNIVALYGTRRLRDHSLALIMEYVPGHTLKSEIQQHGPLAPAQVTRVLTDIARGLAYAHRQHIVHRDIKPENIYIDHETGSARLSDFGIARPWNVDSDLTLPGTAIGTPTYMSPEQIDGGMLDGRSDLFSLSLVGYEMLTGRRPWAGESLFSIVYKQKTEDLPGLAAQRPDAPSRLVAAIERALRKDPKDRWPDAEAFLQALGQPATPAADVFAEPSSAEVDPEGMTITFRRDAPEPVRTAAPVPVTPRPAALAPVPAEPHPALVPMLVPTFADDEDNSDVSVPPRRLVLKRPGPFVAALVALVMVAVLATIALRPGGGSARAEPSAPLPKESPVTVAPPPSPVPEAPVLGLVATNGATQEGVVGDTLPEPLVLRVTDASGRPAPDALVRFVVRAGTGTVIPTEGRTDAGGLVRARWVPLAAGAHELEAQLEQGGAAATFRARAAPRPAARLRAASAIQQRGNTGSTLPPLVVRAEDKSGKPVSGAAVRFEVRSGGGRVTPEEAVTGSDGTARARWVLGDGDEKQEVEAVLSDVDGASVSFTAKGVAPPLPVRRTIAAGGTHSCSLSGDGTAVCWGGNETGQLGDGSTGRRGSVRVSAPEPLASLSAGISHTCGIGVSGTAYCWGTNSGGQLGDGSQSARAEPVRVSTAARLTNVVAGMSHSCALDAGGNLFCWGQNANGQLGDGTRTARSAPVRVGGNRTFRTVSVGWAHTCALTTGGAAVCWGRNSQGELGDGSTTDRTQPTPVAGGYSFIRLVAGSAHTCGLRADGSVLCWGQNTNGQLGTGDTRARTSPAEMLSDERFSALTAGGVHTCGLTRDGTAWCWGRNTYGQLGDGTTEDRSRPTMVAGARRFSTIAASGAHTCASTAAGGDYCWGLNLDGQLGDGTRTNQTRPVPAGRR